MISNVIVQQSVLLCFAYSATLTWTGSANTGRFHDAGNWNTNSLPSRLDHVNILSGSTVLVTQDITVMSMRVAGNSQLDLAANLEYLSGIVIDETATVLVREGRSLSTPSSPIMTASSASNPTPSVSYPTITVGGTLQLEGAKLSGSSPGSGATNVEYPSVVMVTGKGVLRSKGRSAIHNARVLVSSVLATEGESLGLNFVSIESSNGANLRFASSVQNLNAESTRASLIIVGGDSTMNVSGTDVTINVPVTVGANAVLSVDGEGLTQSALTIHGTLLISNSGHLQLGAPTTCSATSSIHNLGTLSVLASTTIRGNINGAGSPSGTLRVRATLSLYSLAFLDNLVMEGGNLQLQTDGDALGSVRTKTTFEFSAGQVSGTSNSAISLDRTAQLMVTNGKAQKVLSNVVVVAAGSTNTINAGAAITVQDGAQIVVDQDASLAVMTGAEINGINGALTLITTGSALVDTGAKITCQVKGNGSLVLTKTTDQSTVEVTSPVITLGRLSALPADAAIDVSFTNPVQIASDSPTFTFPASVTAPGVHMIFSNAIISAGTVNSRANWKLNKLTLIGSTLKVEGNVDVADTITLGMDKNAGSISNGIYSARVLVHNAGSFTPVRAVIGNQECPVNIVEKIVTVEVPATATATTTTTPASTEHPITPTDSSNSVTTHSTATSPAAETCTATQSVTHVDKEKFLGLEAKKAAEVFFYLFIALTVLVAMVVSYCAYKYLKQPEKPGKTYENPGRASSINMSGMSGGLGIVGGAGGSNDA